MRHSIPTDGDAQAQHGVELLRLGQGVRCERDVLRTSHLHVCDVVVRDACLTQELDDLVCSTFRGWPNHTVRTIPIRSLGTRAVWLLSDSLSCCGCSPASTPGSPSLSRASWLRLSVRYLSLYLLCWHSSGTTSILTLFFRACRGTHLERAVRQQLDRLVRQPHHADDLHTRVEGTQVILEPKLPVGTVVSYPSRDCSW